MSLKRVYGSLHNAHGRSFVLLSKAIGPGAVRPAARPGHPAVRRGRAFLGLSAGALINSVGRRTLLVHSRIHAPSLLVGAIHSNLGVFKSRRNVHIQWVLRCRPPAR
eukprot:5881346-Lingulodinium_polyedra.AAC.1